MIRYIHGSEDSTDVDVIYIFEKLPDKNECKKFCSEDPAENRNIITVENGVVTSCYKGTIDEINNALLDTYNKHEQQYPLIIDKKVPRVKCLKYIRAVRGLLSHLSRSQYRTEIKTALKSNWSVRLKTLHNIDLSTIDFSTLNNNMSAADIAKVYAFQIGQCYGLMDGIELYTKSEIAKQYPALKPYLYRYSNADLNNLSDILYAFINKLMKIQYIESGEREILFVDENIKLELIHENII